jgi:catechol 2,3-dioxygenase-like lactoylglutathione lyase family enzyme
MFNHVSIGVKDTVRSKSFYDAALKPLGFKCAYEAEGSLGYGTKEGIGLWIGASNKPVPAEKASGLHFCFDAPSRKAVDAFYDAAMKAGGKDNGKPGLRTDYSPTYYAAFVVDPDGYRIEAVYAK